MNAICERKIQPRDGNILRFAAAARQAAYPRENQSLSGTAAWPKAGL